MALQRYTLPVDGTIPVKALLYTDEQLYATQEGVGIYDGHQKSPPHQSGTIHATTHRLFYIDVKNPENASFSLDLVHVSQTEYYAGLFTSSPKVTLYLKGRTVSVNNASSTSALAVPGTSTNGGGESWECEVCGCKNRIPAGHSPSSSQICELCGVPRPSVSTHASSAPIQPLSKSLPSSPKSPALTITDSIACPACTFFNHPSLRECEVCDTDLPAPAPSSSSKSAVKSAPATRPTSPDTDDEDGDGKKMMKVSFRKGGDKPFYTVLKRSLQGRAWESRASHLYKTGSSGNSENENKSTTRGGITGILRSVETSAQGRDSDLKSALQDLEALMIKARDMVKLAGELNEKLTSSTSTTAVDSNSDLGSPALTSSTSHELPEEATFIRSSLSQLGLQMTDLPVTNDMIKDEDQWVNELAKELAGVLKGMMKDRGIIALDEVWGGWNRARGVALLPPTTLLLVLPHLPNYTSPQIRKRTFAKSGLSVLHTPRYAPQEFSDRLVSHLMSEGSKTTMEVAMMEGITVALTKEMIDDAETKGDVVRDNMECYFVSENEAGEGGSGGGVGVGDAAIKWWPNVFTGYTWDGEVFNDTGGY